MSYTLNDDEVSLITDALRNLTVEHNLTDNETELAFSLIRRLEAEPADEGA